MFLTLHEVCERLRTDYGHHDLWLDWQEWPFRQHHSDLEHQPVVISCSGRRLAAWDGSGESWSFVPTPEELGFNMETDYFNVARNTDNYLNVSRIAELKEKYPF